MGLIKSKPYDSFEMVEFKQNFNINQWNKAVKHVPVASIVWALTEHQKQWMTVFQSIVATKVQCMYYYHDTKKLYHREIISLSLNISFPCLFHLELSHMDLRNINFVQKLNCSVLKRLHLTKNNLIQISALRKCHFNQLSNIYIQQNFINEFNLAGGFFQNDYLETLRRQSISPQFKIQSENINFIYKVKGRQQQIVIENKRIWQKKLLKRKVHKKTIKNY